jgi:hypothetical protein
MKSTGTRAAVAITVAVAVIAAIVAIAVSGGGGHTTTNASAQSQASGAKARGDVALAAAYLGVTRAQLHRELRSGRTLAQIANSTKGRSAAGLIQALVSAKSASLIAEAATTHLTAAKRSARLARLRAHVDAEVNRTRTGRTSLHVSGDLTAASSYLGIGRAELRSDLLARRTLAQVAAATHGKSTAGLIEAIVADRRAKLAAQVAAGHLSQTQEQSSLATLQRRVTRAVNRVPSTRAAKGAGTKAKGGGEKTAAGQGGEAGEAAGGLEAGEGSPEAAEG